MYADVSETENGEGMKHSALPSRNANKEVAAQSVANKISINQDSGRVGGADKGKVGNQRRGKSAVEGEDVEMHGLRPNPFLERHVVDNGLKIPGTH